MARKKATKTTVNFKGIEGKAPDIEEGKYKGVVVSCESEEGDAGEYWAWKFDLFDKDDDKVGVAYFNTSLAKQALFNLRGLLEAMGEDVPDGPMEIDREDMEGKEVGVVMGEDEYKGKVNVKMVDYFPVDELEGGSGKGGKKKTAGKGKEKEAEPEKLARDEVEKMDEDELKDVLKKYKIKNIDLDDFPSLRKQAKAVIEALEEKELLED